VDLIRTAIVRAAKVERHGWVNKDRHIFRFDLQANSWTPMPGAAKDVGIDKSGTVWIIGKDPVASGGYGIFKWTGSTWENTPGGAVCISVDDEGQPWVVAENHIHLYA